MRTADSGAALFMVRDDRRARAMSPLERAFACTLMGLFLIRDHLSRAFCFRTATIWSSRPICCWRWHSACGPSVIPQTAVACAADDHHLPADRPERAGSRPCAVGVLALVYRLAFHKGRAEPGEYVAGFCYIVAQSSILGGLLSLLFLPLAGANDQLLRQLRLPDLCHRAVRIRAAGGSRARCCGIADGMFLVVVFGGCLWCWPTGPATDGCRHQRRCKKLAANEMQAHKLRPDASRSGSPVVGGAVFRAVGAGSARKARARR